MQVLQLLNLDYLYYTSGYEFLKESCFICTNYQQKSTERREPTRKHIRERFRKKTEFLVDMLKSNFCNTNDDNSSRRFLESPQLDADITKVDFELIYRLKVKVETISSGHEKDVQQFDY